MSSRGVALTRMARQRRLRLLLLAAAGLSSAGLALGADAIGVFAATERQTVDARFALRGAQKPPADVVLVKIDDVTFDALRQRWPFPRSYHARLIDRLAAAGAGTIVYDVQFTEPTTPRQDNALIGAVRRAGDVVLATTEVDASGRTRVFGGGEALRWSRAHPASGLVSLDPDGVARHVRYSVEGLKTMPVVATELVTGRRLDPAKFGSGAWIDFAGPAGTIRGYSFSRVLGGQVPADAFRGKVVVVGPWAPSVQNPMTTSAGADMSGVEYEANAIETLLHGFPLRSAPRAVDLALIVLLALVAPGIAILADRSVVTVAGALATGGLFAVAVQLAFDHGRVVSFVCPLAGLGLATAESLGVHYLGGLLERERVRDVFARFVPEQVVDEVLARTDADLRLGGVRVEGTVMFCDLRGFTHAAEQLSAEQVIEVLNRYLGEMSDAILAHGGTLVSYMGDGIMAVFGAPIERPDHAEAALAAAREMLNERLPRFNEWALGAGIGDPFRMGIGLNSGPLMSGNVGHERRLEYTAVGDTTNTASRIEALTKGTPFSLLVSGSTFEQLPGEAAALLVYVDEVEVRGRVERAKLYGLAAEAPVAAKALLPTAT